ncbi:hypothetical protein SeMB42_g03559 [Synchytrium endobioticum]|uniref:Sugar transporter SWEET1 n=1 Tax=Synchytrium endobioticum TaxID=286115 RepID=A0A507CIL3_9FUNG|nr:hypothetical protein SeLEV6574_g07350 [Synchytrium endobioticum]TPX46830.1 hypothetical protein SeMB42_g03559 [Synchytrium endobioticum]
MADTICQGQGSHACDILLKQIIPAAGVLTSIAIFTSPMIHVLAVRKSQKLGALNPLPYPLMAGNCLGWALYGYIARDYYVMIPNLFGWSLSTFYLMSALPHMPRKRQDHMMGMYIGSQALLLLSGLVAFITLGGSSDGSGTAKTLMGCVTTVILVLFYLAPLSTLMHIIQTKDSSSVSIPLAVTSLVNGLLWGLYGLALADYFVACPNLFGFLTGCLQAVLKIVMPHDGHRASVSLHDNGRLEIQAGDFDAGASDDEDEENGVA